MHEVRSIESFARGGVVSAAAKGLGGSSSGDGVGAWFDWYNIASTGVWKNGA